jgi:adenylylsulfate kinase
MISILIMGLPGAGKTTLAKKLIDKLQIRHTVDWFNADKIRTAHNDWDFSDAGRLRQAHRLKSLTVDSMADYVICDFIAPTPVIRKIYNANYTVYVDTIRECKYSNTNKVFLPPMHFEYTIVQYINNVDDLIKDINMQEYNHDSLNYNH